MILCLLLGGLFVAFPGPKYALVHRSMAQAQKGNYIRMVIFNVICIELFLSMLITIVSRPLSLVVYVSCLLSKSNGSYVPSVQSSVERWSSIRNRRPWHCPLPWVRSMSQVCRPLWQLSSCFSTSSTAKPEELTIIACHLNGHTTSPLPSIWHQPWNQVACSIMCGGSDVTIVLGILVAHSNLAKCWVHVRGEGD